jgi:hypothetical protein
MKRSLQVGRAATLGFRSISHSQLLSSEHFPFLSSGRWHLFPSLTRQVGVAGASGDGAGYLLGSYNTYVLIPGIVAYNMSSGVWANNSAAGSLHMARQNMDRYSLHQTSLRTVFW